MWDELRGYAILLQSRETKATHLCDPLIVLFVKPQACVDLPLVFHVYIYLVHCIVNIV